MTYETKLRKVGGSVMVAIPPVVLEELGLSVGTSVDMAVKSRKLVMESKARPRYTMDELLKQTKPSVRRSRDRAWTSGKAVGRELI